LEYYVNLTSAFFSIASLLVLLFSNRAFGFNFQTWVSFIPSVRHPHSVSLIEDFTQQFEDTCSIDNLTIATFEVIVPRDTYNISYVVMPMAYEIELVPAALLLTWVLAVSAAFQTYRAKRMRYVWRVTNKLMIHALFFAPHAVVHFILMIRLITMNIDGLEDWEKAVFFISLFITCTTIHFWPVEYRNNTPDFGRWLEYMLTAPIQIAIIAMSVWLRDRSTLIALGSAQACMLLCGVVLEQCIHNQYQSNTDGAFKHTLGEVENYVPDPEARTRIVQELKARNKTDKDRNRHVATATVIIAWITFFLIWFVIITQFWRQADTAGQCDKCASYPIMCPIVPPFVPKLESVQIDTPTPITVPVPTIVNGVTTLVDTIVIMNIKSFVVQNSTEPAPTTTPCSPCPTTGQGDFCRLGEESECTGRNQIPSAVSFIVGSQCLAFAMFGVVLTAQLAFSPTIHGEEHVKSAWFSVAVAYSVLSVTAKTSLEIGFLVMLTQMPQSKELA